MEPGLTPQLLELYVVVPAGVALAGIAAVVLWIRRRDRRRRRAGDD